MDFGLFGTLNIKPTLDDVLAEAVEIEHHLHNHEKWLGLAGTPDTEVHRADRITLNAAPFVLTSGDNDWGAWLQILGSTDTPVETGKTKFDFHEFLVVSHTDNNTVYQIQIVDGESAGIAAKLTAEDFTEIMLVTPAAPAGAAGPVEIINKRVAAGTKVWARILARGQTGTLSIYVGLHEYDV